MTTAHAQQTRTSTAPRIFALVTGVVYVVLGLGGFLFASDGHWGIFGAGDAHQPERQRDHDQQAGEGVGHVCPSSQHLCQAGPRHGVRR